MTPLRKCLCLVSLLGTACAGQEAELGRVTARDAGSPGAASSRADAAGGGQLPGDELVIDTTQGAETYVNLAGLEQLGGSNRDSDAWDLVFSGWDIFTNSGASGSGDGAAFGPSDPLDLRFDLVPGVPLRQDTATGAFEHWYGYTEGELWSLYHRYGIRDGARLWKLQLLGYYGELDNEPTSAVYQLRYAAVDETGARETVELMNLNATGDGSTVTELSKAACLNLETGQIKLLNASESRADSSWQLCFLRNVISTNSGLSGPGNVLAVDLDAEVPVPSTSSEVEALVRDQQGARERFDAVEYAMLTAPDLEYAASDRASSAFTGAWVTDPGPSARLVDASWIVRGASGDDYFALLFTDLEGPSEAGPGVVTLRVKPLEAP